MIDRHLALGACPPPPQMPHLDPPPPQPTLPEPPPPPKPHPVMDIILVPLGGCWLGGGCNLL